MADNYCSECEITVYDIPYAEGGESNGYLNPERCPMCGGWLE